jgi:hypothetical protein
VGRPIRLPKLVERDSRAAELLHILTSNTRPLWSGGEIDVPVVNLGRELAEALRSAHGAGRVVRGLESANKKLAAEERGLSLTDQRTNVVRGARVSRLLLLANDGAERFYRHVETLLRRFQPRVLAVLLAVDAAGLGELLFGPNRPVRLLMIEHKDAVCSVLIAMASRPTGEDDPA